MSVHEELSEGVEHAKEPFDKMVAVTMAIIAALLAIVSVASHIYSTEELLAQQKASDQWAFYQAKDIRRYDSEIAQDFLKAVQTLQAPEAAPARVSRAKGKSATRAVVHDESTSESAKDQVKHYSDNAMKYDKDRAKIEEEAKDFEKERDDKGRKGLRLEIGEIFLEVGIVFASLAILTKRPLVWYTSMLSAGAGVAIALSTTLIG